MFSTAGLDAALAGVVARGEYLSLHDGDPGSTGAAEDAAVARLAAGWQGIGSAEVDSTQVAFIVDALDPDAGERRYTHFGVWSDVDGGDFLAGGELDQAETFSANGGTYNFTATLTAASAAA